MTSTPPVQLSRSEAVRRVRLYNNLTIGWNVVEGVVAIAAGIAAGSISLIAFRLDSGVEVSTSLVLAWRLAGERRGGCMTGYDQRATRLIAICFAALAVYVGTRRSPASPSSANPTSASSASASAWRRCPS